MIEVPFTDTPQALTVDAFDVARKRARGKPSAFEARAYGFRVGPGDPPRRRARLHCDSGEKTNHRDRENLNGHGERSYSRWITIMGMKLHVALIVLATAWVHGDGTQQAPKQTEIWVNPGVSVGASGDPNKFVNTTDAAFIGVLEDLSVGFLDDKQQWLFTTMTFRVTDVVFSKLSIRPGDRLAVMTHGGWFEERGGKRVPTRPADIAEGLKRGSEYFVPVTHEQRSNTAWTGKTVLSSGDALLRLDNGDLFPVQRHSKWPAAILSHAQAASNLVGPSPTRRTLFLATLRSAAQGGR